MLRKYQRYSGLGKTVALHLCLDETRMTATYLDAWAPFIGDVLHNQP